jgi:hypothetical protein
MMGASSSPKREGDRVAMPSERVQRQIDRLLDEAERASATGVFSPEMAITPLEMRELLLDKAGGINRAPTPGTRAVSPTGTGQRPALPDTAAELSRPIVERLERRICLG